MATSYVVFCAACGWTQTYQRNVVASVIARHDCPTEHRRSCRTCGWKATYSSAAKADWAKRRHSCTRRLNAAASADRGRRRRAAVDRTPKPCLHKIAVHVHGTYAAYVLDQCRCDPCSKANRDYEMQRTRQQAYGRWDNYVDAQPARDHILALVNQGMGLKRIVKVSDISQGLLWKLIYGKRRPDGTRTPSKRVRKATAERILAIRLDLADGAVVPTDETTRRIQALVANGWSMSKLAARLGISRANFTPLAQGTRNTTVETAKAVYDLYRDLVDVEPPHALHRDKIAYSRSLHYAVEHGWAKPIRINGRAWTGQRPGTEALADVEGAA